MKDLIKWKNSSDRKPLMLEGARQVGKTYLLKQFGAHEYENFYYLNFDEVPNLSSLFEVNISASKIIERLSTYFQTTINPSNSLICFDEIQECQNALASLKYFCEDAPEYHIATAGSLLGVKLKKGKGFPVGKVTFRELHPLSFLEFLHALGKHNWIELIQSLSPSSNNESVPEIFHTELCDALKKYIYIGGMPEAVKKYVNTGSFEEIPQVHHDINRAYELDFAKHATPTEAAKISLIWKTMPSQLAKENKKFMYNVIRPSARAREYESAIQWLEDANLILKTYQISKPGLPLQRYANHEIFKTYLHDIGLLAFKSGLSSKIILEGNTLFTDYKGALTENYVAQSLNCLENKPLFYWASEGRAEVDFVIEDTDYAIPIEVKSGTSKRNKSLLVYNDRYTPKLCVRTSLLSSNYGNGIIDIPLYALSELPRILNEIEE